MEKKNGTKPEDISENFCIMPWIGVASDGAGGIHPCCWMEHYEEDLYNEDFSKYKESDYLNNLKQQFLNGVWPKACNRCHLNEEKGNGSKRQRENLVFSCKGGDFSQLPDEFSIFDIRFSNLCNLGCVMCSSKNSSFIQREIDKFGLENFPKKTQKLHLRHKGTNLLDPYNDKHIADLEAMIGANARIYFAGGEPSLIKKAAKLLKGLRERGYNKTLNLEFNSNFQLLNRTWIDLLKDFKGEMWPSIDGIGDLAEYVRYPCDWELVASNLKTFLDECEQWRTRVMPTVCTLSIFNLKELYEWCYHELADPTHVESGKFRVTLNNRLYRPHWLDIRNLPQELKEHADKDLEHLEKNFQKYERNIGSEFNYLEETRAQLWYEPNCDFKETIRNIELYDALRGNSWRKVLPILRDYVDREGAQHGLQGPS